MLFPVQLEIRLYELIHGPTGLTRRYLQSPGVITVRLPFRNPLILASRDAEVRLSEEDEGPCYVVVPCDLDLVLGKIRVPLGYQLVNTHLGSIDGVHGFELFWAPVIVGCP